MSCWRDIPKSFRLVTAPTVEPVTPAELREHLRQDSNDEDQSLSAFITSARQFIEKRRNAAFITQTWRCTADEFPDDGIELWPVPVISVSSITYVDADGVTQTWDSSDYTVDVRSYPGRVVPAYGESWPTTRPQLNAVTINYTAGYGATASYVPESARVAVKLLAGDFFENREATQAGAMSLMPLGFDALISTVGVDAYR